MRELLYKTNLLEATHWFHEMYLLNKDKKVSSENLYPDIEI